MERKEEKIFYIHMAKPLFGSILAFIHCFGVVKYNNYQHFHCFLEVSRAPQQPKVGLKKCQGSEARRSWEEGARHSGLQPE
jgi:hypothetical protein